MTLGLLPLPLSIYMCVCVCVPTYIYAHTLQWFFMKTHLPATRFMKEKVKKGVNNSTKHLG